MTDNESLTERIVALLHEAEQLGRRIRGSQVALADAKRNPNFGERETDSTKVARNLRQLESAFARAMREARATVQDCPITVIRGHAMTRGELATSSWAEHALERLDGQSGRVSRIDWGSEGISLAFRSSDSEEHSIDPLRCQLRFGLPTPAMLSTA